MPIFLHFLLGLFLYFIHIPLAEASIDFSKYQKSPLIKEHVKFNLSDKKQKIIIIIKSSKEEKEVAKSEQASGIFYNMLFEYLKTNSSIKVVRRSKKENLDDEIKLHELKMEMGADYALVVDISKIKHSINKISLVSFIEIYSLPDLEAVSVNKLRYKYSGFKPKGILLFDATSNFIERSVGPYIIDEFNSLKPGYITKKMANQKESIYKISLGKKDGIETGKKLKFFALDEDGEKETIGSLKITGEINDNYSWLKVKNKYLRKNLGYGSEVKLTSTKTKNAGSIANSTKNILITGVNGFIHLGRGIGGVFVAIGSIFTAEGGGHGGGDYRRPPRRPHHKRPPPRHRGGRHRR